MKRLSIIGVFGVLFFIAAIAFSAEDTNKFWFPGDSGSSWTYQGPSSNFSVHKACGAFNASAIAGLEDVYDVVEEEKPFFNAFYTSGAKMGPFGIFAASEDAWLNVYGYNGPTTLKTIQASVHQEFSQVGATMNEFRIFDDNAWRDKWVLCDVNTNSYPWCIMPPIAKSYLDFKISLDTFSRENNDISVGSWQASGYRGVGTINITVGNILVPVEYSIEVRYMMDAVMTKELASAGYPQSLRLELHKKTTIIKEGLIEGNDQNTAESVWWLVSGIGPVKIIDNVTGTEVVLKDYKILPGSGKAVNPGNGNGKVATTWGNIKK